MPALKTVARKTTPSIKIGTTFNAAYADSSSLWTVMEKRGADTYTCEIKAHPEYGAQIDWLGTRKVFGGEEIRAHKAQTNLWKNIAARADDFWSSRKVGEIVHYDNGFEKYVRGIIVKTPEGMKMKPIALVGAWDNYDMPRRDLDGTIRLSYHAKKIASGETMQPNDGSMYESANRAKRGRMGRPPIDPTKMDPINLTLPEMTDQEERIAKLEQQRSLLVRGLSSELIDRNDIEGSLRKMLNDTAVLVTMRFK